jgi:hypothetical protein
VGVIEVRASACLAPVRVVDQPMAPARGAATWCAERRVDVPDALFEDTEALRPWFDASLDWIASLKSKPTRRAR